MNRLQAAMEGADMAELEAVADEIGRAAVIAALGPTPPRIEEEQRQNAIEAEQRQRDLDAALADAIEVVARQRQRLGRRSCTAHDGATTRRIFEALRAMLTAANSSDPGFP